ncbi:MAG: hypothetical protein BWY86_01444 [Candidatus Aminicenantes bacterium ADurb.Bin508]|nr:MAG: hypothetical protein BWY86_01444 [Candidatus Aminicenantes bacterium ADurb.Bin508]
MVLQGYGSVEGSGPWRRGPEFLPEACFPVELRSGEGGPEEAVLLLQPLQGGGLPLQTVVEPKELPPGLFVGKALSGRLFVVFPGEGEVETGVEEITDRHPEILPGQPSALLLPEEALDSLAPLPLEENPHPVENRLGAEGSGGKDSGERGFGLLEEPPSVENDSLEELPLGRGKPKGLPFRRLYRPSPQEPPDSHLSLAGGEGSQESPDPGSGNSLSPRGERVEREKALLKGQGLGVVSLPLFQTGSPEENQVGVLLLETPAVTEEILFHLFPTALLPFRP